MLKKINNKLNNKIIFFISIAFSLIIFIKNNCHFKDNEKLSTTVKSDIKVIDGDTIKLSGETIRLYGIDTPEKKQKCSIQNKEYSCGEEAKYYLINLIKDKEIKCITKSKDLYKRYVSICYMGNIDINQQMVRSGMAIAYGKYSKKYMQDELYAKEKKLGIWRGKFTKPEEWRRSKKSKQAN